jgi:hypothetical protein
MGIGKSVSDAVCRVFDSLTSVAGMAESAVKVGTNWVDNRAESQLLTDEMYCIIETEKTLLAMKKELDADEKLKAGYEELRKTWRKAR